MDWLRPEQLRCHWPAVMRTVISLRIPKRGWKCLGQLMIFIFSRITGIFLECLSVSLSYYSFL
jgi:small neutral amino acid transporter SnatA (MarC family)